MPDTYQFKESEVCNLCIVRACCNDMCKERVIEMFKQMPDYNNLDNRELWKQQYEQRVEGKIWTVRVDANT